MDPAAEKFSQARRSLELGDLDRAWEYLLAARAGSLRGGELDAYLGYTARQRGDVDAAADHYADALEANPLDAAAHNNLAEARRQQGHLAEAIALFRRAGELAPEGAEIFANLGATLLQARRPEPAIAALRRAVAIDPGLISARSDLAICLSSLNRYPEAIEQYQAAYRLEPANNDARYLEALALLALGDFKNGWRKHEVRWYAELGRGQRNQFDAPMWLGEPGIEGKTILLHAEQGLGDTLQFARFAPMVGALGARVILLVRDALVPILRQLPDVARVMAYGEDLPPFDIHCSLMSLPRAFRTDLDTIPATIPYVAAPMDRVEHWRRRLGPPDGRRRIAVAWSGSRSAWNRAIAPGALAPLLTRADCAFYVAQTEIRDPDRAVLSEFPGVSDLSTELADFADTAALLNHMDVVITVDTVLAHLAGALGRPVWTMLPYGADYRWRTEGATTAWYPSMRLFRQPAFDDWASVVASVGRALDGERA